MQIERAGGTGWVTLSAALVLALAGVSTGCAKAQAAVEPEMPALAVPPPPPRVLPPLEGQPIEAATTAPSEPQARPRAPRSRPEATRAAGNGTSKPETRADAAVATAVPSESPVAEAETQAPPPAIQLAPAGDAVSEQNTRGRLVQAERDLQRVDYQRLNSDAKVQYDTAKRFIVLAQQAITDRNLLFAHTLADKAATIAAVLQRR